MNICHEHLLLIIEISTNLLHCQDASSCILRAAARPECRWISPWKNTCEYPHIKPDVGWTPEAGVKLSFYTPRQWVVASTRSEDYNPKKAFLHQQIIREDFAVICSPFKSAHELVNKADIMFARDSFAEAMGRIGNGRGGWRDCRKILAHLDLSVILGVDKMR